MTATGIPNQTDEAASSVLIAFINLLFSYLEREYPNDVTRIKVKTLKLMQQEAFEKGVCEAFQEGLRKRPISVPILTLPESRCRDITQLVYNVACEIVGPVETDGAFASSIDAVNKFAASRDYPVTGLL